MTSVVVAECVNVHKDVYVIETIMLVPLVPENVASNVEKVAGHDVLHVVSPGTNKVSEVV